MVFEESLEELPSLRSMHEKVLNMRSEFVRRHHCSPTGVFEFSFGTFHKSYHCEFNPIELVWGYAKSAVAKHNGTYNLKRAMAVMREECLKCDAEYWKKVEKHAIKEEQKVLAGDVVLRAIVERAAHSAQRGDDLIIVFSASEESEGMTAMSK